MEMACKLKGIMHSAITDDIIVAKEKCISIILKGWVGVRKGILSGHLCVALCSWSPIYYILQIWFIRLKLVYCPINTY